MKIFLLTTLLLMLLLLAPQLIRGAPQDKQLTEPPTTSSTQKDSPRLSCPGEAIRNKQRSLAALEPFDERDCPAEGSIRQQPLRPADPFEPGRPLRFE